MIDPNELDPAARARRVLTETDSGREAVRALFYARERRLPPALTGRFDIPTYGNWECLTPEHQSLIGSAPLRGSGASSDKART